MQKMQKIQKIQKKQKMRTFEIFIVHVIISPLWQFFVISIMWHVPLIHVVAFLWAQPCIIAFRESIFNIDFYLRIVLGLEKIDRKAVWVIFRKFLDFLTNFGFSKFFELLQYFFL